MNYHISLPDLPQNFDSCITIMSDYNAQNDLLNRGYKKPGGQDIFVVVFQPIRELEFRSRLSDLFLISKIAI